MTTAFENTLIRCGLNETEATVFAMLVERGEATASALATRLHLKRATAYSALGLLEARQLVCRRKHAAVTRFRCVHHSQILRELSSDMERRVRAFSDARAALSEQLKSYPEYRTQHIGGYKIESFESRARVELFFRKTLAHGHYDSLYDITPLSTGPWRKLMLDVLQQHAITKPPVRELIISSSDPAWYLSKIRNPHHQVRVLTGTAPLSTDFTVTRECVILNSYESGAEISLQIHHPGYRSTMARVFDELWRTAKSI